MTQALLFMDSFDPSQLPTEELRKHRQRLLDEFTLIDQQLAEPQRTHSNGQPMSSEQYDAWRYQAIRAKNAKLRQYRLVKAELTRRENQARGRGN
jgi:hypothetical protein